MNKNIVLIGLGAIALVLVSALFLFSPQKEHISLTQPLSSQTSKNRENIDITYQKENSKIGDNKSPKHQKIKSSPKPKKIDSSIKYMGMDHYRRYILKLIDRNLEDRNIRLTSNNYRLVGGSINGNQFNMKVPKKIIDSPNLELEIIDTKTGQKEKIDASFLQELSNLPQNSSFTVNINLENPQNIQTNVLVPTGNGAFEGINR